jgi:glycosyltransferase involved in cell wall biosynthesis
MHILFLTDNFPPEVNAPASRTHEHCRAWVAAGHRVTVVTCAPNFPTGRLHKGYSNKLWQQETVDGIRVIRVWTYIARNDGFGRRIIDYLSFMVSATVAGLLTRAVDVVVGTSPQFFTACAACLVGGLKRRPFVFELRDIWPESIKAVGAMRQSIALTLLEKLELLLYRRAARIVSVTHSFRRTLAQRGVDAGKIDVVTNGVDINRFSPRPKDVQLVQSLGLQDKFVAGYIGTHGMAHGLETLLEAAERIQRVPGGERFRIVLLGDGARRNELRGMAADRGLDNVLFLDSVPKEEVARYWSILDVSIIHLRRAELFTTVIPSKLFECMGMGVPVLLGVLGESADIVNKEGIGLVFEPENPRELAEKLVRLAADRALLMQYRASCTAAAQRYDRAVLANSMLRSLESAVEARRACLDRTQVSRDRQP